MDIAARIQSLEESAPLQITQRAGELRRAGKDIVGLGAGEPDFPTPEHIRAAGIAAIDAGKLRYTDVAGVPELREAVSARFLADQGVRTTTDQVIVSTGAKQALYNALVALADPTDTILIPAPYWVSYPAMCHLLGLRARILETRPQDGFKIDPQALDRELAQGCKVFLFNSPNNPTGAVYTLEELRALGEVLSRHSTWILTDEIYEKLVFDEHRHHSLAAVCPDLAERIVVVNGVSKSYAMTGWRIGYALGPRAVVQAMMKVQGHTTSNATSVSQYAALAALTGDQTPVERMRRTFADRRLRMLEGLRSLPEVNLEPPGGAFYLFPDMHRWYSEAVPGSTALCRDLLETVGLALVPGEAFGDDRCIRLSYAASDETLDDALSRLRRYKAQRS